MPGRWWPSRSTPGALSRYPDAIDEELATAGLADVLGVAAERVLVTNGGSEAIALVAGELGRGWVDEPDFSLYGRHLHTLQPGAPRFRSDPHNPTGRLAGDEERAAVWDEAFYPLATGRWSRGSPEARSDPAQEVPSADVPATDACAGTGRDAPAVVVGSLTKTLACPGLRLGYIVTPPDDGHGLGHPGLLRSVSGRRTSWSVGTAALRALPALLDRADLPGWAGAISRARAELVACLGAHGLVADPSDANFVLVRNAPGLRDRLAPHGVMVRDCASFGFPDAVRIAVPDAAGLARLDAALDAAQNTRPSGRQSHSRQPGAHDHRRQRATAPRGALMVCGTASDVGKSAIVAGLCRLLARQGVAVAPFKGQNMALNSVVTVDGAEIGRAQGMQAAAARTDPEAAMNPVLLKPTSDRTSQVVVMGRPWRTLDAAAYQRAKPELADIVLDALADLRRRFDVVLCEGAGSPAEINLFDGDLVNLGLAARAGIPAVVVGDIDRGGVFAHLYGTVALLPEDRRRCVRGFVINKLRGDPSLLGDACGSLRRQSGVPTLGVLPWLGPLGLDAEDSMALTGATDLIEITDSTEALDPTEVLDVAVVRFPRISNFTDLDPLAIEPGVQVRYVDHPGAWGDPDLVVLPGTKSTVADLAWLRRSGLADALQGLGRGTRHPPVVLGICGGYQMLGTKIEDPLGVESGERSTEGLGWLDMVTRFRSEKVTRRRRGVTARGGEAVRGYEIHHGEPLAGPSALSWLRLEGAGDAHGARVPAGAQCNEGMRNEGMGDERMGDEGATSDDEGVCDEAAGVYGTTLHGLLESDGFRTALLEEVARRRERKWVPAGVSFDAARQAQIDRIADACEAHLDLPALWAIVEGAAGVTTERRAQRGVHGCQHDNRARARSRSVNMTESWITPLTGICNAR